MYKEGKRGYVKREGRRKRMYERREGERVCRGMYEGRYVRREGRRVCMKEVRREVCMREERVYRGYA